MPPFPKKLSNLPPKQFFTVSLEKYCFFFEKIFEQKNRQQLISDKKVYTHFLCKITSYRSHSDPVAVSHCKG